MFKEYKEIMEDLNQKKTITRVFQGNKFGNEPQSLADLLENATEKSCDNFWEGIQNILGKSKIAQNA